MSRVQGGLVLSEQDRAALERLASTSAVPGRVRLRARAVLLAADGLSDRGVARVVGLRHEHVGTWRRRFAAEGVAGLEDRRRTGRPRVYGPEERSKVVQIASGPPPDPPGYWTLRKVAEAVRRELGCGMSQSQARRILIAGGFARRT